MRVDRQRVIIPTVRRLVAIAAVISVATSSAALAASIDCPTMRARALSHCCCPPGGQEHARLTCCRDIWESRVLTTAPREQTERVQVVPFLAAVALAEPCDGFQAPAYALSSGTPPSTAGPPQVPLRI